MNDASTDYELLDFGDGRKLERFGKVILDRPSPAAEGVAKAQPQQWAETTSRYERTEGDKGIWTPTPALPSKWNVSFPIDVISRNPTGRRPKPTSGSVAAIDDRVSGTLTFQLQASPFGHVGVFPEQLENWEWIARQVARQQANVRRTLRVLNLFAYTGGSTLAAASAGAEVVHIDAARNIVDRARRNAELSGLSSRPIRWITEDATKFCQRELKRGNRYDAVILDPPSYGHGPKGEPWKIAEHLLSLLKLCGELTSEHRAFVVLTCHTPGMGPAELAAYLDEGIFGHCGQPPTAGDLSLTTSDGRCLPSGVFARRPARE